MNNLEKLTALLYEGSERVKEDISRTEFIVSTVWRKIEGAGIRAHNNVRIIEANTKEEALGIAITDFKKIKRNEEYTFMSEVILEGKVDLHTHHLLMYCNEKEISIDYNSNGVLYHLLGWDDEDLITKLDVNKPLYQQSDEVLEDIINFLKEQLC